MSNNDNHKYTYSKCKFCGKEKSWINDSFMVPDGADDNDWDQEEYCLNQDCPSNNYKLNKKMNKCKHQFQVGLEHTGKGNADLIKTCGLCGFRENIPIEKYPKTKATQYEIETKTLLGKVEFDSTGISVDIKLNDEDRIEKYHILLENSEQLSDLYTIIQKAYNLNMGE